MRESLRELLITVAYLSDLLMRPTFRNWAMSFEQWEYENGLQWRMRRLRERRFIQRETRQGRCCFRLTREGLLASTGGLDPERLWARRWSGKWWLILFDLPVKQPALRGRVLRWLHRHRLGCLQGSLWLSPEPPPIPTWIAPADQVSRFIVLEACSPPDYRQADIVRAAWDFETINGRYEDHLALCRAMPIAESKGGTDVRGLVELARQERLCWEAAAAIDPFLPGALCPLGYRGRESWERHKSLLGMGLGG